MPDISTDTFSFDTGLGCFKLYACLASAAGLPFLSKGSGIGIDDNFESN
jgi:hypothetical protein